MEFRNIKAEELHSEWAFIKQGLQVILEKTKDRWLPEDIYWLIKQNSIWAYVVFDEGVRVGVVLLQLNNGWDGKELYIFGGWNAGEKDVIEFSMSEILKAGKYAGAKRLKMQSNRRGFERYASSIGFSLDHVQYEREL